MPDSYYSKDEINKRISARLKPPKKRISLMDALRGRLRGKPRELQEL